MSVWLSNSTAGLSSSTINSGQGSSSDVSSSAEMSEGEDDEAQGATAVRLLSALAFVFVYLACGYSYYLGITSDMTEVTRFTNSPLAHSDFRSSLQFIKDLKYRELWLAYYVLVFTTFVIPAVKFTASIVIIWDIARGQSHGIVGTVCSNVMHVLCSYQMADVFAACLLCVCLNARFTSVKLHAGFWYIGSFVLLSIIFQHASEIYMMKGRCFPRARGKVDTLSVLPAALMFFACYWFSLGMPLLEVWFREDDLLIERTIMSLNQTFVLLNKYLPWFVCFLYVFSLVIAPNLYVASLVVVALFGRRQTKRLTNNFEEEEVQHLGNHSDPPETPRNNSPDGMLVGCAEALMFWLRPWAMLDEYVLMLWVIMITIRVDNVYTVEGYPVFIGLSALRFLTGAALSLSALRWSWFSCFPCCQRRLPSMTFIVVVILWVYLCFMQLPERPDTVATVQDLNDWLTFIRGLGNNYIESSQPLPGVQGNCQAYGASGMPATSHCVDGDPPYVHTDDDGSNLIVRWLAGLDTLRITHGSVTREADHYIFTVIGEMQFLSVQVSGKFCKGSVCGDLDDVLLWGRLPCAKEGKTCRCQGGTSFFGNLANGRWAQPLSGTQACTVQNFGMDPRPGRIKDCFCATPKTLDPSIRELTLRFRASCTMVGCAIQGNGGTIRAVTLQSVDLNSLVIATPVTLLGGLMTIQTNWTDLSTLLENEARKKVTQYLAIDYSLPFVNQPLLPLLNNVIEANCRGSRKD
eukprot:TRINITY_DN29284_c0_g2_i1.p1 TRINITY_DN29284_c0_g2~~TRINITY_DN29284_c0_g2_i1.p1  ORF type:complete len:747 (+),score=70.95 TRINITY_DN29284_c0_g2_i1:176-2416(+)